MAGSEWQIEGELTEQKHICLLVCVWACVELIPSFFVALGANCEVHILLLPQSPPES